MSLKDRRFAMDANGGILNPDSHLPCGAVDPNARQLEKVHFGNCKGCFDAIALIYTNRSPPPKKAKKIEQARLSILEEDPSE